MKKLFKNNDLREFLSFYSGARDRNRTGTTVSGPGDFKSPVSTNFTTRATKTAFYVICAVRERPWGVDAWAGRAKKLLTLGV